MNVKIKGRLDTILIYSGTLDLSLDYLRPENVPIIPFQYLNVESNLPEATKTVT